MKPRAFTPAILVCGLLIGALALSGCEKETHRMARREFQEILGHEEDPDSRAGALESFVRRFPEAKTNPYLVRACTLLAEHHARAGRSDIAASWYERAVRVAPDDPDLLNALGYHYASHGLDLDRAVAVLEKAVLLAEARRYPARRLGFIKDSLGWAYRQRGDLPLAVAILEESVRLAPDAPILREHLAEAYRALGERDRAADIYLDLYLQGRAVDPRLRGRLEAIGTAGGPTFRRLLLQRIDDGRRAIDEADARQADADGAALVRLRAADGRALQGALFLPPAPARSARAARSKVAAVLLVHALGSNRSAATPLAQVLARRGIAALTLDLRGHGGSVSEEIPAAHHFSEHLADNLRGAELDARAALDYLGRHPRVDATRLGALGAGLGALVAIRAASSPLGPRARGVVLLSPWGHPDAYVEPFLSIGAAGVMLAYGGEESTAPSVLARLERDDSGRPAQIVRVAGDATGFELTRARRDLGERIADFLEARLH